MPLRMLGGNTLRHKILPAFRRFSLCGPLEGIEFFVFGSLFFLST